MKKEKVLVGIPTLNGPDRLTRCLRAIVDCTDFKHFDVQVTVADDGSERVLAEVAADVMLAIEELRRVRGIDGLSLHYLRSETRTGIASTWNRIIRADEEKRPLVVLINDDVEVVDDWLDVLAFSVANNHQAGMVGLNSYCGVTKGQVPVPPRIEYVEAKLQSGDGLMIASHGPIFAFSRARYDHVCGFDERYFVFYEEVDFGVKLLKFDLAHYIASYPIVYHMGGATNSDPKNLDAAYHLRESRKKFHDKWNLTLDEIRLYGAERRRAYEVHEWNTQLKVWRDE